MMRSPTLAERLIHATPRLVMAIAVVPVLAWLLWEGGTRRLLDVVALGAFVHVLLVALVSDRAVSWASRRFLNRLLARPVLPGEETSLNTWMRFDADRLTAATDELERLALL